MNEVNSLFLTRLRGVGPALSRFRRRHRLGAVGAVILVGIVLAAVFAPWVTQDPYTVNAADRLQGPSWEHWFGTDNFGRDIFARTVHASRTSVLLATVVTAVATALGLLMGLLSGYYSRVDAVIMRFVDGMLAFPGFVLAIAMVAALGGAGVQAEMIALTLIFTPLMARLVRAVTLQLRSQDYIRAAVASGATVRSILLRHVLPNGASPIIVLAAFTSAEVLLADAGLSFLGLGAQPPTPTWGNMVSEARPYLTSAPWFAIFPGLAIILAVMSLHLVGDALRDSLNARTRSGGPAVDPVGAAGADNDAEAGTGVTPFEIAPHPRSDEVGAGEHRGDADVRVTP